MHCVITVKGNGVGKYGHPKNDRTGPISEFLVDNQVFYRAVNKHLKDCTVCDPVEILKTYLNRRISNPKFEERVSDSLVKQAMTMERQCAKRGVACDPKLINEFIWRSGTWEMNGEPLVRLEIRDIFNALRSEAKKHPQILRNRAEHSHVNAFKIRVIAGILLECKNANELDDGTLEELIQVAEVQLS